MSSRRNSDKLKEVHALRLRPLKRKGERDVGKEPVWDQTSTLGIQGLRAGKHPSR